jgi:hypothetical protein
MSIETTIDKFINWFFTEIDMYDENLISGIFGDYIINKIIGEPIKSVELYVYSLDDNLWKHLENPFLIQIERVWNIFNYNKIHIEKKDTYYQFQLCDINFKIYGEKPFHRNIFTYQLLHYERKHGKFYLTHTRHNSNDPLYLLKILNHVKRRQLIPLHPKNLKIDHIFFIADRHLYIYILDIVLKKLQENWNFKYGDVKLHLVNNDICCSICHNDDINLKIKLECGHNFHVNCLKQLILLDPPEKCSNLCPNCRTPIQLFY